METKKKSSGLSIAAMVLGIVGLVLSCLVVGIFPCIVGLILSIIALISKSKGKGMAIAGLATSIVGIASFLLFLFVFGFNSNIKDKPENTNIISKNSNVDEKPKLNNDEESIDKTKGDSKQEDTGTLIYPGESFEANNLKITFLEYVDEFTDYEDEYDFYKPEDGNKYIKASFLYENIGNSGTEYVSIYDFSCYADNQSMEQAYLPDGNDFINENISSGRNASFSIYFQVPAESKSIELEYTKINIFSDNDIIILKCK